MEAAIDFAREVDVLIVTRLDRLARSVANMLAIAERLEAKRATLKILDPDLETESATGGLIFTIIGAIAEFERSDLVLKDGTTLKTLSDARALFLDRFSSVTHSAPLTYAGILLQKAAETGKRADIEAATAQVELVLRMRKLR